MFNPILPNVNKTHDHLSPQITRTILYHDICQVLSGLERPHEQYYTTTYAKFSAAWRSHMNNIIPRHMPSSQRLGEAT